MSHAVFSVSVVELEEGTHGALAAKFVVEKENVRRSKVGLPLLPVEPWAILKASYLSFLSDVIQQAHENYIKDQAVEQAKADQLSLRWLEAGEAERTAALTALPEATEH